MASSQSSYHPPPGSHPMLDQNAFAAFQQSAMGMGPGGAPQGFYGSFPVFNGNVPVLHSHEAAAMHARHALQHPGMHTDMSGPSQQQHMLINAYNSGSHDFMVQQQMNMAGGNFGMMSAAQQHFHNNNGVAAATKQEDSSGEFDDAYGMEEESMEHMMEMCEDPVMRERLRIVQQAQEAASSEGASGIFACPYCDKQYSGKHARSIWRRHLQDKHAIPLSQQPRRTRWDGDANRPKNAEERRQRMLESKRRWARKKRMMDKVNAANTSGDKSTSAGSVDGDRDSEVEDNGTPVFEPMSLYAKEAPAAPAIKTAAAPAATKKRSTSGPDKKHRGMQQLKFHHLTTTDMPQFVEANGGNHASGAIKAVWTTMSAKGPNKSERIGQSQAPQSRVFSKHASMPAMPQQMATGMFGPGLSPRRAFAEVDSNTTKARSLARTSSATDAYDAKPSKKKKSATQPTALMPAPGPFEGPTRSTPIKGFNSLYPAQPLAGDDKSLASRVFGPSGGKEEQEISEMGALPPPTAPHTLESGTFAAPQTNAAASAMSKRHSVTMLSPVTTMRRPHQSPASNPFSLDQHKISPATSKTTRRIADGFVEPPSSATRLTSALNARNGEFEANRLSPLQSRLGLKMDNDSGSDLLMMNGGGAGASPVSKARKLPPLLKTPLRPGDADESSTSNGGALGFITSGLGSASVRRTLRRNGTLNGGVTTTPTQHERMMAPGGAMSGAANGGASSSLGLTPFDVRQSAKYSVSRAAGYYSRASPAKRDFGGGDQFSSPQHLNLTQSLGLAPHSTVKGSSSIMSGMNSLTGTPYVNSFMSSASPWPESVLRPSFRMSASKRGSNRGNDDDEEGDENIGNSLLNSTSKGRHGSSDNEADDDDDDDDVQGGLHETPSRPAKHPHPSSLGGSPSASQQQRSSATRSHAAISAQNNSSASRSRRSAGSAARRPSDLPPLLNFNVSSPAPSTDDKDDDRLAPLSTSSSTSKKTRGSAAQAASFDHALLDVDSPGASHTSSDASSVSDIRDEDKIDESI